MIRPLHLFLPILLLTNGPLQAGFEEATQAYADGNKREAFIGFNEASEAGDVRAFGKLGSMYLYGLGTERNYRQAYLWFGLAKVSGDKYADGFQRAAASMLKVDEIKELQPQIESRLQQLDLATTPD